MERFQNRRVILIVLAAVALLCLVGVLAYNVFFANGGDVAVGEPPTATVAPTDEAVDPAAAEEGDGSTPTPTRVIAADATEEPTDEPTEEPTSEPTEEPTAEPTVEPTTEPTSQAMASSTGEDFAPTGSGVRQVETVVETVEVEEILKNGSFEEGFTEEGVGVNWASFETGDAIINFSRETAIPFVLNGENAQRISIDKATVPDQFGGIYQKVEVTPGEVYTLTIHGQIRSGFGDVNASSYGYRAQYAVDYDGGENWRAVPADDWVELPWQEQGFEAAEFTFSDYTTQLTPTSDEMTLFVRGWNKWADQTLGEYTFDSLSLVGPVTMTRTVLVAAADAGRTTAAGSTAGSESEELIDQPLPVTGAQNMNLIADGRFWGALAVLLLLALGAVYRAKWRW